MSAKKQSLRSRGGHCTPPPNTIPGERCSVRGPEREICQRPTVIIGWSRSHPAPSGKTMDSTSAGKFDDSVSTHKGRFNWAAIPDGNTAIIVNTMELTTRRMPTPEESKARLRLRHLQCAHIARSE